MSQSSDAVVSDGVRKRLAKVLAQIAEAAARAGREAGSVRLVAVSKRKPAADIVAASEAGCLDFGENYVQELADKATELDPHPSCAELRWHYIGHLQRNKVKQVLAVPRLQLLHGVDSRRLLAEIDKRTTRPIDVLIQVNVSGEEAKSGCGPEELGALLDDAEGRDQVRVVGLMTMPPIGEPEEARPHFRALAALRDAHGGAARLPELSMGMSHDYPVAIEEGATLIRVGTAIFGPRS